MAESPPPRVLLVLGPHRSGTSALARMLDLLGAELGPNLMAPEPGDNELGFWEPRDVVDLHDELLRALGSAWQATAPLPEKWWRLPEVAPFRDRLADLAAERFGGADLIALKDPRLCRLLPLWRSILADLDWRAACVFVVRSPLEVAASLARRNDLPRRQSYHLWLDHALAAEEHSRRMPRVFVTYDQLLADWRRCAQRIARGLSLTWPVRPRRAAPEIEAFLSGAHRHFDESDAALDDEPELAAWIAELYAELRRAAERGETSRLRSRFGRVRSHVASAARLFGTESALQRDLESAQAARERERERSEGWRAAVDDYRAELERTQHAVAEARSEAEGFRSAVESYRQELDALEAHRAEVARTRESLDHAQARADAVQAEWERARERLAEAQGAVLTLRGALEAARNDVRSYTGSLSWKLTAPLRLVWDFGTGLAPFAREMRGFPRRARYTWRTRGAGALASDVAGELARRLRRGTLAAAPAEARAPATTAPVDDAVRPPLAFPEVEAPRASVVIPACNGFAHTYACLASLLERTHGGLEVVLVDDASRDETREIERLVSGLAVVRAEENAGFVASCNRGAEAARGEFLVFLNNDTLVTEGWLDALLEPLERDPSVGLVGGKLVYPDGRLQEAGGIVFRDASGWNYGRGDDPSRPRYSFAREVDYCSGACLALRRAFFQELGGFDDRYAPAYYEDVDLAFAVRAAGKRVLYQPFAEIVHLEGATAGTDTGAGVKRFQPVNREKFAAKWREALALQPEPDRDPDLACFRPTGPHVLVVDSYTPRPDRDAGSVRMFEICRLLTELGCHVAFAPDNRALDGDYTRALQALGVQALHHPWLPSLEHHLKEAGARYRTVVLSRMDVAAAAMASVRQHCPRAQVVFDTVDLHFLRESRRASVSGRAGHAERLKREELAVASAADLTLVVSPAEKEILAREAPDLRVEILSLIHRPEPTETPFPERAGVVFVANFQHPPNRDAIEWYLREVHPLVRERLPDAPLHIVGADAPKSLARLGDEHVRFPGWVPDIRPLFAGARVSVAPLRYGAGIKGKISTSLAYGVPVVTTPVGAEGMDLKHGEDAMIAETPEDFAAAVVAVHGDPALWQRLAENGLESLAGFSPERARRTLAGILGIDAA